MARTENLVARKESEVRRRLGPGIGPSGAVVREGRSEMRADSPRFTLEQREAFISAVAAGRTRSKACKHIGIAYNTFMRAYRANEAFRDAVDLAEREGWDIAVEGLRDAVVEGEPWAIQFVLKSHRGLAKEWDGGNTVRVEHSGKVEQVVSVGGLEALVAELQTRRQELSEIGGGGEVLDVGGRESGN